MQAAEPPVPPPLPAPWITDELHSSCLAWRRQLFETVIAGNANELSLLLNSDEYASIKANWSFDAVNLRAGVALQKTYPNDNHHEHATYQNTCLHHAVTEGHEHIVRMLLNCDGVDVNPTTKNLPAVHSFSRLPIMLAVANGNLPIFQMLVDHGAMLPSSMRTLSFAANSNNSDIFRYVLGQHGISGEKNKDTVDLRTIATHENDVLTTAINEGRYEIVEILIEFCRESPDDIGAWFNLDNWAQGVISLYRHAVAHPTQHSSLLTFHMCRHHVANQSVPESKLQVFNTRWPPVVGYHIEGFLLPSIKVRRTMQNVVNHFEQHLLNGLHHAPTVAIPIGALPGQTIQIQTQNGRIVQVDVPLNSYPGMTFQVHSSLSNGHNLLRSLLFEICNYEGYGLRKDGLELLSFLLAHEQLEVNKLVNVDDQWAPEDTDDADDGDMETCLRFALRLCGSVAVDVNAKMIAALVAAGGVVRYEDDDGDDDDDDDDDD